MSAVDLPLPSTNRLWRSNRGRVHRAPLYLSWLKEAGWSLLQQRPARITGPVRITIPAGRPDRRRRDIDNLGKAILDFLVGHQVITNDSQVASITSSWSEDVTVKRARAPK
jgi:crossover junction endodeoxyribonuclease RusA